MQLNNFLLSKFKCCIFFLIYFWLITASSVVHPVKVKPTASTKQIRFTISESWGEPYTLLDSESKISGGLMPDLINAIAKKLKGKAEFIHVSRKRLDVLASEAGFDIRCFTRENWASNPEIFCWSKNIFTIVNQIVWKDPSLTVKNLNEIKGKTVGAILGYNYKGLDDYFASGKLVRSDVKSESINYEFLKAGRVDYAVFDAANLDWTLKNNKTSHDVKLGKLDFDVLPVKCAVLKTSPVLISDLNHAISDLEKEGFFDQLSSKYGLRTEKR